MNTHYHYIIWGYERVESGTGNYIDNVIIDIISDSEELALDRAKQLVEKPYYTVRSVIEHFNDQPCKSA
jgi:hypothetical protein